MNLQTNVQGEEKELDETLEEKARIFNEFCGLADNKGAVDYFNRLSEQEQEYIRKSKKYGWGLKAVLKMRCA